MPQSQDPEPATRIAELFGHKPTSFRGPDRATIARNCPFRGYNDAACDVSANRNSAAQIDLNSQGVTGAEAGRVQKQYGSAAMPLGICSCWTQRQFQSAPVPWILCPRRLLSLDPPYPVLPKQVLRHIDIPHGTMVRVWREFKLVAREADTDKFFDSTFDFLLVPVDENGDIEGPPYIIEVMTASTRGTGLKQHAIDVLLGAPQRRLSGQVKSVYTPNYRQVAQRMLGQMAVKASIARYWGGRAIWIVQDVLLDYISETTALDVDAAAARDEGDIYAEVFRLDDRAEAENSLHLSHKRSLRLGVSTARDDVGAMLSPSYLPPFDRLKDTLRQSLRRTNTSFQFKWDREKDPQELEP